MTVSAVLKDSMDGPEWYPSFVVEGDCSNDDLLSALSAAPLAIKPLELFNRDDSLFLTCLSGLSRKLRVGDLGGEAKSSSATLASAGFETEMVFFNGLSPISVSSWSMVGNTGTEADLACLGDRSGM
jgi:hypothetical protein